MCVFSMLIYGLIDIREEQRGHFEWYDPKMCPYSKAIIPGLIWNRTRLEEEMVVLRAKQKKLWVVLIVSWFLVFCLGFVVDTCVSVKGMQMKHWKHMCFVVDLIFNVSC